jgi:FkbM family methyltransferase
MKKIKSEKTFILFNKFIKILIKLRFNKILKYEIFKKSFKKTYDFLNPNKIIELNLKEFKILINSSSNIIEKNLLIYGVYEEDILKLIRKKLKEGDVFLDIGANIGYHSLFASKIVGKAGQVYSFEPVKETFEILKKNIQINKFNNIKPFNYGVSNKNGKTKIFFDKSDFGRSSLLYGDSNSVEEIELIKLDTFFGGKKIDFVKIDVEGEEFNVIKGMEEIIKNNKNIKIILEFSPIIYKKKNKKTLEYCLKFLNYLENLNFKLSEIKGSDLKKIKNKRKFIKNNLNSQKNIFCEKNKK